VRRPVLLVVAGVAAAAAVLAGVLVPVAGLLPATSGEDRGTVIAAAGDIACDPTDPDFRGGAGSVDACHEAATADLIGRIRPSVVLALGDIQYVRGDPRYYLASYDPTWGRFRSITRPAIGNHEGGEGGSSRTYFQYFGPAAGDPHDGYYSFDLGGWHLIALNSNCGDYEFDGSHDGCREGSPQDTWLRRDLAAHAAGCTLAYFHVPRFSSATDHHSDAGTDRALTALWRDLYAGGVDVVLNGHSHVYERFAPMTPDGARDDVGGIREFVVGTGGDNHDRFSTAVSGSEYRNNDSFGVLRMTLMNDSYAWRFLDDGSAGATGDDAGSAACHRGRG
jgi:acid phosphatase type 7